MQFGDMAIISIEEQIAEVYCMGHDRFKDFEGERSPEKHFDGSVETLDFGMVTSSAWWVNNRAPDLRARAGFADSGHGIYAEERDVGIVADHSHMDDRPIEVDVVSSSWVYEKLVDAYRMGCYDALDDTYDVDAALALV